MQNPGRGQIPALRLVGPDEGASSCGPYIASKFTFSSGERFAAIIDSQTGVPPDLALRYALAERGKGGAARLTSKLRRIAELYNYLSVRWKQSVDDCLQALPEMSSELLYTALHSAAVVRSEHSKRVLAKNPKDDRSGALTNKRIEAWMSFFSFVYRPSLWKTGLGVASGYRLREEFQPQIDLISEILTSHRIGLVEPTSHKSLRPDELAAIDEVLKTNRCNFEAPSLLRNRSMYYTARITAARKGEFLKLKLANLPDTESKVAALIRRNAGRTLTITIERNHDDPEDTRENEPRVKRSGRVVEIPDELFDILRDYKAVRESLKPASQYLFLTADGKRPLSISRTDAILKQISRSATLQFETQHPGVDHTLRKLTWHRLRTTRANELLPIYFPNNQWDPNSEDDFLYALGWKSRDSARPYLLQLRRSGATDLLDKDRAALRSMTDSVQR